MGGREGAATVFYRHKNLRAEWVSDRKMKGCYGGGREGDGIGEARPGEVSAGDHLETGHLHGTKTIQSPPPSKNYPYAYAEEESAQWRRISNQIRTVYQCYG